MAVYYIDLHNGRHDGDALSPHTARSSYTDLELLPGDTVLFRRGTFVRGNLLTVSGEPGKPVTYGAYGEGEKPTFCGSVDLSDPAIWTETAPHIWQCTADVPSEAGNFIFDFGCSCGAMCWTREEMAAQGDWFDNRAGSQRDLEKLAIEFKDPTQLLLFSEKNPGEYYTHIECSVYGRGALAFCEHDMIFENLRFENSGVHGVRGAGRNITVRGCDFFMIGGCAAIKDKRIRFGNAVEFWEVCENCTVEHCRMVDIYDSGITHQGKKNEVIPRNAKFDHNFFARCGMGAYECRDFMPANASFSDNICLNAGEGFSKLGEVMPRNSEIHPLPMGHHIFMWRVERPTEGGKLTVRRNRFFNSPVGAAIFAMISEEAAKQMDVDENVYYTDSAELLNYVCGKFYADFDEYQRETGWDAHGVSLSVMPRENK